MNKTLQEVILLIRQYGDLNYKEAYADCQESDIRSTKAANLQKEILQSIEEKLRKFVERSPITPERFDTTEQAVRRAPAAPVPQWDGEINPADFNVETFRRSGNGWPVKPDNCVRITHMPTGLFEEGVAERSIHTNKAEAWERLSARLEALAAAPEQPEGEAKVGQPHFEAEPVQMPEPIAYLHECGKKPSLRTLEFSKVAIQLSAKGYKSHGLYTEQQVRQLLATHGIKGA